MPLRVTAAALFAALVCLPCLAQGRRPRAANSVSPDEAAILEIEYATFDAIKRKDAEALGRHLAEEFVYRTPADGDIPRAEFLKGVAAMPYKIISVRGDSLKVSLYGDVAVLTGVQFAAVETAGGAAETSAVAFTDVFVRRRGRWLMTLAYGVELAAPPKVEVKP